ncbi:MAG TPA: tyrosine-type recombinase/integrase [Flavobacterium sp.]|jgi:integrase/recombinase XerD
MKHLTLKNQSYIALLESFTQWLDVLGYAPSTVYYTPIQLKEFFYYLEGKNIQTINEIHATHITAYYEYLKERPKQRKPGGLSDAYLNKHQQALLKFREYLKEHNHKGINIHLRREEQNHRDSLDILTQEEIKALFKACDYSHNKENIRARDKAMLVLLYSCGLRRNEVVNLKISDVLFDKNLILVRKGKNYKERFVPVNNYNLEIISLYIYDFRIQFYNYKFTESLLINQSGKTLQGTSLCNRLKAIVACTNDNVLKEKHITPHILRHSIATHLLEKGANIETISAFLGHSSLESTQIYTHLLEHKSKTTNDEQLHRLLREKRLLGQEYPNIPKPGQKFTRMG